MGNNSVFSETNVASSDSNRMARQTEMNQWQLRAPINFEFLSRANYFHINWTRNWNSTDVMHCMSLFLSSFTSFVRKKFLYSSAICELTRKSFKTEATLWRIYGGCLRTYWGEGEGHTALEQLHVAHLFLWLGLYKPNISCNCKCSWGSCRR